MTKRSVCCLARSSNLSKAQVIEISGKLPRLSLQPVYITTHGDRDQKTSLRTLEKTDFFTREIDQRLLNGEGEIAIHSAKDLPDPLPKGLSIFALTQGIDARDTLVFREGEPVPKQGIIGTSSIQREERVRSMLPNALFQDIRGTIEARLNLLEKKIVDGVVIAEAALIRLNLKHLSRIYLPPPSTKYQGQLAIIGRSGDDTTRALFTSIDCRKKTLYLGITAPTESLDTAYTHLPLIETLPLSPKKDQFEKWETITHLLFTSGQGVKHFKSLQSLFHLETKKTICIGQKTAQKASEMGFEVEHISTDETSEGVVQMIKNLPLQGIKIFWPHSALSRNVIRKHLSETLLINCPIYTTQAKQPRQAVNVHSFDEILFTSPSIVNAFADFFPPPPAHIKLTPIGPITAKLLEKFKALLNNEKNPK